MTNSNVPVHIAERKMHDDEERRERNYQEARAGIERDWGLNPYDFASQAIDDYRSEITNAFAELAVLGHKVTRGEVHYETIASKAIALSETLKRLTAEDIAKEM